MMADMNKPRKDGMVRIPIDGGPDANLGWHAHWPHPTTGEPAPSKSWTMHPSVGLYRLKGDGPTTWRYVWQSKDDFLAEVNQKAERFR